MLRIKILLILSFILLVNTTIISLNEFNFDTKLQTGDWVLEFCSPLNDECRKFDPVYQSLSNKFPDIQFGRVDVSTQEELQQRYSVNQLPTVFYIKDKQLREVNSKLTLEDLASFIEKDYVNVLPEVLPRPYTGGEEEHVYRLSANNFDMFVERGRWLVQIGATWCTYCKDIEYIWKDVAQALYEEESDISVAFLDGSKAIGICERYDINGFPTILLFENGKYYEYTQPEVTFEGVLGFVNENRTQARSFPKKDLLYLVRFEYYEHYQSIVRNNLKVSMLLTALVCIFLGFVTGYTWNLGGHFVSKNVSKNVPEQSPRTPHSQRLSAVQTETPHTPKQTQNVNQRNNAKPKKK